MRLILRKDVPKLGLVGDVVEVSEGFGRNYLLPHHLALVPSKSNLKIVEQEKVKAAAERARRHEFLKQTAARIAAMELTIPAAANPEGQLYGSVGPRDISRALMAEGITVHPDQVRMDEHIKRLDTVMVNIHLGEEIDTQVKVWVVPEKTASDYVGPSGQEGENRGDAEPAPSVE